MLTLTSISLVESLRRERLYRTHTLILKCHVLVEFRRTDRMKGNLEGKEY